LDLHQGPGGLHEGGVGGLTGRLHVAAIQVQPGFEHEALGGGELELVARHDFASALADADVTNAVLARVAPVGIKAGLGVVPGQVLVEWLEQVPDRAFADTLDERVEFLGLLAVLHIVIGDLVDRLGDAFGGNRDDGQPVGAGVVLPLAAEHDLEVGTL